MYYFASDMHFKFGETSNNRATELQAIKWLNMVAKDAKAIYLLGDIFDFWFEYKRVVPKGFVRILGKIAELTDSGIEIHIFAGNHDMWMLDYFEKECGMIIHRDVQIITLLGKKLLLRHGDAVGVKSLPLKLMNSFFRSKILHQCFSSLVHPNLALKFGCWWSGHNRDSKNISHKFRGENEPLVQYSKRVLEQQKIDYFIFGHIHCAEVLQLNEEAQAIFLGEWIENPTYARMDNDGIKLLKFQ